MISMVTAKSVSQNEYLIQFIGLRLNKAPRRKRRGIKCALQAEGFQPAYAPRGEELNPKRLKHDQLLN